VDPLVGLDLDEHPIATFPTADEGLQPGYFHFPYPAQLVRIKRRLRNDILAAQTLLGKSAGLFGSRPVKRLCEEVGWAL
jgi:hypothetical protein